MFIPQSIAVTISYIMANTSGFWLRNTAFLQYSAVFTESYIGHVDHLHILSCLECHLLQDFVCDTDFVLISEYLTSVSNSGSLNGF